MDDTFWTETDGPGGKEDEVDYPATELVVEEPKIIMLVTFTTPDL